MRIILSDLPVGVSTPIKLRSGKYMIPGTLTRGNSQDNRSNNRVFITFPYSKPLIEEVKTFEGRKWHGFDDKNPRKVWSFPICQRNQFKIDYLTGENPYAPYDAPLIGIPPIRECLRDHQVEMLQFVLTRRHCILAGEMGTGKSLVAIEAMDYMNLTYNIKGYESWYVGPRSGVKAVGRELLKWNAALRPRMFTYNKMVQELKSWVPGRPAPRIVIFDESSHLKTPTTQRSQQAQWLADSIRQEWGRDSLIVEMTGSPAPKSPVDWWKQCEISCPGFIKEGNVHIFKRGLSLIEERQGITGTYPHMITWYDDEKKCIKCGEYKEHECHNFNSNNYDHIYSPSINEIERLYKRMKGLVLVVWKKDCLDLPEKQYEILKIKPTPAILRAAKLIKSKATKAITALTLLRELADGFQYEDIELDELIPCENCDGTGTVAVPIYDYDKYDMQTAAAVPQNVEFKDVSCSRCGGSANVARTVRTTNATSSPKDQVFRDLLEEHSDIGRFVVWGGFTGTLDRLIVLCHSEGWATLRVDGDGYVGRSAEGAPIDSDTLLSAMDRSHPDYEKLREQYPKVCFVGHPQAGGMALTLTASPTALYYSNSFNGEARIQSEDRIHRMGMDENKGARIIDLVMLPSDRLVLNNLLEKKKLQTLSMGDMNAQWEASEREI